MNEKFPGQARQLHKYIANQLTALYDRKEAENIAEIVLSELLGVQKNTIILNGPIALSRGDEELLRKAVDRLLRYEPVQYVCNKAYFYGRPFFVNKSVLIPRPETEELVSWVLHSTKGKSLRILDIGSGSGCIAVTLALEMPEAVVYAVELTREAVDVGKRNADENHATVHFINLDVLKLSHLPCVFDLIISNPPYIPQTDERNMHRNVLDYEPHRALFVDSNDPLLFYRKIAELGEKYLSAGGYLFFEIHEEKAYEIKDLLEALGYQEVSIAKDLQGKDRMIKAHKGSHT